MKYPKSTDLAVEMMLYKQHRPGHIKPRNARRRDNSLMRILDNTIITERERATQEKQQRADRKDTGVLARWACARASPASLGRRA